MTTFRKRSRMPASAAETFAWHAQPGAFERLVPPWERIRLLSRNGGIENGARADLELQTGPFRQRWVAEHRNYVPGEMFQDVQIQGPFARWEHTHRVVPGVNGDCQLEDAVEYELPFGILGRLFGTSYVQRQLERTFAYRHRVTSNDLGAHQRGDGKSMKVAITGASGLVGTALVPFLTTGKHEVVRLVRKSIGTSAEEVGWDPKGGTVDVSGLEGVDAVVHLAGENIAGGRWNSALKKRIRDSRVEGTRTLCEALATMENPPKTLVCASAIGYYGDRGEEVVTEESAAGSDFLADVCQEWEAAADAARAKGIRVVHCRLGVVLSPKGGALAKMLMPFKMGVGGIVGNGKQYWSWVSLDDVIGAIHHALITEELSGPINVTAPNPSTNREFTRVLGKVLRRPTILPMPAFAAKLALGEMAEALLLASARVQPTKLKETGYIFRFPELEGALRHLLGK